MSKRFMGYEEKYFFNEPEVRELLRDKYTIDPAFIALVVNDLCGDDPVTADEIGDSATLISRVCGIGNVRIALNDLFKVSCGCVPEEVYA